MQIFQMELVSTSQRNQVFHKCLTEKICQKVQPNLMYIHLQQTVGWFGYVEGGRTEVLFSVFQQQHLNTKRQYLKCSSNNEQNNDPHSLLNQIKKKTNPEAFTYNQTLPFNKFYWIWSVYFKWALTLSMSFKMKSAEIERRRKYYILLFTAGQ